MNTLKFEYNNKLSINIMKYNDDNSLEFHEKYNLRVFMRFNNIKSQKEALKCLYEARDEISIGYCRMLLQMSQSPQIIYQKIDDVESTKTYPKNDEKQGVEQKTVKTVSRKKGNVEAVLHFNSDLSEIELCQKFMGKIRYSYTYDLHQIAKFLNCENNFQAANKIINKSMMIGFKQLKDWLGLSQAPISKDFKKSIMKTKKINSSAVVFGDVFRGIMNFSRNIRSERKNDEIYERNTDVEIVRDHLLGIISKSEMYEYIDEKIFNDLYEIAKSEVHFDDDLEISRSDELKRVFKSNVSIPTEIYSKMPDSRIRVNLRKIQSRIVKPLNQNPKNVKRPDVVEWNSNAFEVSMPGYDGKTLYSLYVSNSVVENAFRLIESIKSQNEMNKLERSIFNSDIIDRAIPSLEIVSASKSANPITILEKHHYGFTSELDYLIDKKFSDEKRRILLEKYEKLFADLPRKSEYFTKTTEFRFLNKIRTNIPLAQLEKWGYLKIAKNTSRTTKITKIAKYVKSNAYFDDWEQPCKYYRSVQDENIDLNPQRLKSMLFDLKSARAENIDVNLELNLKNIEEIKRQIDYAEHLWAFPKLNVQNQTIKADKDNLMREWVNWLKHLTTIQNRSTKTVKTIKGGVHTKGILKDIETFYSKYYCVRNVLADCRIGLTWRNARLRHSDSIRSLLNDVLLNYIIQGKMENKQAGWEYIENILDNPKMREIMYGIPLADNRLATFSKIIVNKILDYGYMRGWLESIRRFVRIPTNSKYFMDIVKFREMEIVEEKGKEIAYLSINERDFEQIPMHNK